MSQVNDNANEAVHTAKAIGVGTKVTSISSSSDGYVTDNLYLNNSTWDLWKCTGTNTWELQGNIKGATGATGQQGLPGENGQDGTDGTNGTNSYIWVRYSESADGTGFNAEPTPAKKYMGVYAGTSSTAPTNKTAYAWVKYIGEDGQGVGDMCKSDYDTNNNGIVDNSEALGGKSLADLQMSASGVGSIVTLDNTDADKVMGMMLFGKSTQASVPTPTNPVDIVSVGDDGDVKEILCGKNLLNNNLTTQTVNGLTITVKSDKSVVVNGTATATTLVRIGQIDLKKGKEYILNGCPTNSVATLSIRDIIGTLWIDNNRGANIFDNGAGSQPFIPNNTISTLYVTMRIGNGETVTNAKIYPMLRFSNYTDIYEPYSGMTATIPLTNPLRAIKVGSGGNYTDEIGQQWIRDTLEYMADGSGKLVQYIAQYKFTGNETVTLSTIGGYTRYGVNTAFQAENEICESTHFEFSSSLLVNNDSNNKICVLKSNGNCYLRCDSITSVADLQTFFQNNDVYIDYILATPIETDLTPEQVAQFENLQSYYPITTAYTDDIGDLSITCVCPHGKEMADDYVLPKVFNAETETTLADDDCVPFYDDSEKGNKQTTWSNIKAKLKAYFDTFYNYGTVIKDTNENEIDTTTVIDTVSGISNNTALNQLAGALALKEINERQIANGTPFYYDYQDGQYGYNTAASRGADTFHPFSKSIVYVAQAVITGTSETVSLYNVSGYQNLTVDDIVLEYVSVLIQASSTTAFKTITLTKTLSVDKETLTISKDVSGLVQFKVTVNVYVKPH